jgi:hypothetical protein
MRDEAQSHYPKCDPWQTADLIAFVTDRDYYKHAIPLNIPELFRLMNNPGMQVYSLNG